MSEQAKVKAHVIRDFKDEGTGESFKADSTPTFEAGAFANYEAAGLVRKPGAEDAKAKPGA